MAQYDIRSDKQLHVWREGMDLAHELYALSRRFPREELFGLASQLRRAGISVPLNIAEGHGSDYLGDYLRHLSDAKGSLNEAETVVVFAHEESWLRAREIEPALARVANVGRMLTGLSKSLARRKP